MNFQKLYGFIKNNGISNAYFRRVASNFNACADRGDSIQKVNGFLYSTLGLRFSIEIILYYIILYYIRYFKLFFFKRFIS